MYISLATTSSACSFSNISPRGTHESLSSSFPKSIPSKSVSSLFTSVCPFTDIVGTDADNKPHNAFKLSFTLILFILFIVGDNDDPLLPFRLPSSVVYISFSMLGVFLLTQLGC